VVAAIGVWGADRNILGPRKEELAQLTIAAARDISRDLGYIEKPAEPVAKREAAPALA
jgi:hypothetical protein